jgi:hypothetical protein
MARVIDLVFEDKDGRSQPTTVTARVKAFGGGPNCPILQIDTFGSESREFPGKISQTLQFDREAAMKLKTILDRVYS